MRASFGPALLLAGPAGASHQPDKVERGVVPVFFFPSFFFFFVQFLLFYWVGIHKAASKRQTCDSVVGLSHADSQRPCAGTQGGDGGVSEDACTETWVSCC